MAKKPEMTKANTPQHKLMAAGKPTPQSSVYVTYNYSKNTSGAVGNGGGITGWAGAPDANRWCERRVTTTARAPTR